MEHSPYWSPHSLWFPPPFVTSKIGLHSVLLLDCDLFWYITVDLNAVVPFLKSGLFTFTQAVVLDLLLSSICTFKVFSMQQRFAVY